MPAPAEGDRPEVALTLARALEVLDCHEIVAKQLYNYWATKRGQHGHLIPTLRGTHAVGVFAVVPLFVPPYDKTTFSVGCSCLEGDSGSTGDNVVMVGVVGNLDVM